MGTVVSTVVKQGCEADHSLSSNAEVMNGGVIPPLPIRLLGVVLNRLITGKTFVSFVIKIYF
jgi:hypothetical protein